MSRGRVHGRREGFGVTGSSRFEPSGARVPTLWREPRERPPCLNGGTEADRGDGRLPAGGHRGHVPPETSQIGQGGRGSGERPLRSSRPAPSCSCFLQLPLPRAFLRRRVAQGGLRPTGCCDSPRGIGRPRGRGRGGPRGRWRGRGRLGGRGRRGACRPCHEGRDIEESAVGGVPTRGPDSNRT